MTVLVNIGQLATCPPHLPQGDAGLINQAALVFQDGKVTWAGPEDALPESLDGQDSVDCGGSLVIPGLVDCHTHLSFGGWRGDEFEMRLQGHSYQDIAAAGGGIRSTVAATRQATAEDLVNKALPILDDMLALGVTTVECKSGYGLDTPFELKLLEVYRQLDERHAIDLVPTFLGAHMIPDEYEFDREGYLRLLCEDLIPQVARDNLALFCDIFVEKGAFTVDEARIVLSSASNAGLGLKVHADQLSSGGGAQLAAEFGAISAEHLEYADDEGIKAMADAGTVAVSLPLASLYLAETFIAARKLIAAGVRVAVATDFNPGSAPSYHLPLAMTLACIHQKMTPQEALTGATTVAARALSMHGAVGSLLPGYAADFAVVDAPNLNHWLYHFRPNACRGVVKSGRWQRPLA